jgi:uncharacterized OB-fold protein
MNPSAAPTHPAINPENQPFWAGSAARKLVLKHCRACGAAHYYPRANCPFCRSPDTYWKEASGRGVIYSFTIMRRAAAPFVVAYVTLEEGPTVFTNLVDFKLEQLAIDRAVVATFIPGEDGLIRPVFRPA